MLYALHDLHRKSLAPVAALARLASESLLAAETRYPIATPAVRPAEAAFSVLHRIARAYDRPAFSITSVEKRGSALPVDERVVHESPFCRLVSFDRSPAGSVTADELASEPHILLVAPLSGHYATLLRETVRTLLQSHNVTVTDWANARDVPLSFGTFSLDDYVLHLQHALRTLGAANVHVLAVCQPAVPVLAAVSLMATQGEPTPRSMTLMGGPIDVRIRPAAVSDFATRHDIAWFERNLLHRVPRGYAGHGRLVYPGFLQLSAFVGMNAGRHFEAHVDYGLALLARDVDAASEHERFYDEYNAVLDLDAPYYLDTVRTVFQEALLPRGAWRVAGSLVRPADIRTTALMTVEGALDDLATLGQTEAAHALCTGLAEAKRQHFVAAGCGHYGLFSGRRWREDIAPRISAFIRTQEG